MKPRRILLLICLATAVALGWNQLRAQTAPAVPAAQKGSAVAMLMQKKLQSAQRVLEGIALADYGKITDSAQTLIQLSKTEEWQQPATPRFKLHSAEFQRAADNLIRKAQEKNIEGAAYAYVELTMTCVRCHQHVRETREARAPVPPTMQQVLARTTADNRPQH